MTNKQPSKMVQQIAQSLAYGSCSLTDEGLYQYHTACKETLKRTNPELTGQLRRYRQYIEAAELAMQMRGLPVPPAESEGAEHAV